MKMLSRQKFPAIRSCYYMHVCSLKHFVDLGLCEKPIVLWSSEGVAELLGTAVRARGSKPANERDERAVPEEPEPCSPEKTELDSPKESELWSFK